MKSFAQAPTLTLDYDTLNYPPMQRNIVNVASVPHRSPFRYPGGKTWLVPRVREWLASLPQRPALFVEPFAGGGIVSLTVAAENLADHVLMVELDNQVAAVWHAILEGDGYWLADRIVTFDLTPENVEMIMAKKPRRIRDKAFQTLLKNRIYRGGILARGSGMLKYGENGKGIKSRWYPRTLKKRITAIIEMRDRITFIEDDGLEVMKEYASRPDAVFFVDPPYTAAGKMAGRRLYTQADLDHKELFRVTSTVAGDFLMTYDETERVRELGQERKFDMELVAMKSTHHAEMAELLIGRNLGWARGQ